LEDYAVTPWEVKGNMDYDKLVRDFGTSYIEEDLLNKIKKHTGELHFMLRRKVFFSHRDLTWIINRYEAGEKFFLYTGRGPSGNTHLGHLLPWIFTQHLQEKFGAELYFQITDDEKYMHDRNLTSKQVSEFSYENILDIIALGFDPKKTFIFKNTEYIKKMYKISIDIAKHVTFSTAKSIFGFKNSSNIGMIFFPALQAATCFLPCVLKEKNIPCLIPAAIDQDDYWRGIAREIAPKLGYYKPAQIHSKFLPGLQKGGKMSASEPNTAIFTTDDLEVAEKKIKNAFTGGKNTIEEHRKFGGEPEIDSAFQYLNMLLEKDDKRMEEIEKDYRAGNLLSGELKEITIEKTKEFLKEHQRKRKAAEKIFDKFILKD
tara:strand:+ start:142 stop:1260 length:1119 start_codon:yes stop_codon:yes gene_type:complete